MDLVKRLNVEPSMVEVEADEHGIQIANYHFDIYIQGTESVEVARLIESCMRERGVVFGGRYLLNPIAVDESAVDNALRRSKIKDADAERQNAAVAS